jgi:hypothetical protein
LSGRPFEGPRECFGRFETARQSDLEHLAVLTKSKTIGRSFEARQRHVAVHAYANNRGELPMEVKFREARARAQSFSAEPFVEVRIDVRQHL